MRIIFYTILVTVGLALSVIIIVPSFFDINTYKNKLYKCAPIANLKELDKKGLYKYEGIGPNGDLEPLISNINKPESVCAMCPEDPGHSIDHFKKENVDVKAI